MNIAEDIAYEYAKENGTIGVDYDQIYAAVIHGYEQAKATKPKALTWQDIKAICKAEEAVIDSDTVRNLIDMGEERYYSEVLKRYNDGDN